MTMSFTGPILADFAGMYVDTSDPVDLDGVRHLSHRIYAIFTDPNDRTFSVAGLAESDAGPSLEFQADSGQLFTDCGVLDCNFFDCNQQSQPVASLSGAYHSFVCIRSGDAPSDFPPFGVKVEADSPLNPGGVYPDFPNNISFTPDVLCAASPTEVRIEGNSWSTGGIDGGYIPADPLNGKSRGQIILIAQFTLPESSEFTFQGNLFYNYTPEGFPKGTEFPGQTEFFVSSSDFSGLSECLNFDQFFTAFDLLVQDDPYRDWDLCGDGIFDFCQGIDAPDIQTDDCNFNEDVDICEFDPGIIDRNDNLVPDTCECIADLDGDGDVNLSDIVILLFAWKDSVDFDVVVTPGLPQGIIDQSDLDVVLAAAVPPDSLESAHPDDRPFLWGCGVRSNDPSPPLPAVQSDQNQSEIQPELTREANSDGLSPENAMPSFLPIAPEPNLAVGVAPRRQLEQKIANSNAPKIDQASEEIVPSGQASGNADALSNLFEILSPSLATPDKEAVPVWDLDQDGLLDPWSVIILPLSSWPEELRPFAELLRP